MSGTSKILFDIPGRAPEGAAFLENLGHPVTVCHGPDGGPCPILTGAGCNLVDEAHGIVFELDLDVPEHRTILARYKEVVREDVPIRVVVRPEQRSANAELLAGLKVWTKEPAVGDLDALAAEIEALDRGTV